MTTPKHLGIGIGGACAVLLGILAYRVFGKPMRYEIPAGFKGWLLVRYADRSCQPLRHQGIFLVVSVPPTGSVCTSSDEPGGLTYYKFEYTYSNGARQSLRWNDHGKPGTQVWMLGSRLDDKTQEIFVGDEHEDWNRYPKPTAERQ